MCDSAQQYTGQETLSWPRCHSQRVGMMANLGCQLEHISSQVEPKQLGTLVRDFLIRIIGRMGPPTPQSASHFGVATHIKELGRHKFCFLPVCPYSPRKVFLCCGCYIPSPVLESTSLGFQCRPKTSSSLGILQDSGARLRQLRHPAYQSAWVNQLYFYSNT